MAATKTLHVPITGGMRQDLSEHMAPVGTLVDAVNVRLSTSEEVEARPGTQALSAATDADVTLGDIWTGLGVLGEVPGGFVVGSEGFAYRYDFAQARLHVAGSYGNAEPIRIFDTIAREQIAPVGTLTPAPLSQAAVNGYVATVYSSGNGQDGFGPGDSRIVLHIFTESGTLVTSALFASTTKAWLAVDGSSTTNMVLITQDTTTGLFVRQIVTSSSGATISAAVSFATLFGAAYFWAVCTVPGIGWAIVYQGGFIDQLVVKTGAATVILQSVGFAITAANSPSSIYADATNIYVGWRDGNAAYDSLARIYTVNLSLAVGNTTLVTGEVNPYAGPPLFGPSLVNGGLAATWAVSRAPSYAISSSSFVSFGELTAAGAVTQLMTLYQCTAVSQPFGPGYIWIRAGGFNSQLQNDFERILMLDFMALRCTTASNRATWMPVIALTCELFIGAGGSSYPAAWYKQFVSCPAVLSDGSLVQGIARKVRSDSASSGLALAEWLQFSTGGQRQATRFGNSLLIAGFPTLSESDHGTRQYDAVNSLTTQDLGTDLGFPLPPSIQVVRSNGAGALTPNGTYSWRAVLERIDGSGRRWRSAPSDVDTEQMGAAEDTATLTCSIGAAWLRATALDFGTSSQFVLHVYRTAAGGSTLYRASPAQGAEYTTATGTLTFVDLLDDVQLVQREILYTDGGVLNNDCPPSCRFVRTTEDRVWLGGLWESNELQSSKIIVPGEPPQFSDLPAFRVVLPEPCTGIAYQDGTVVAFTRTAIYAIQGGGPNDQGQGAWESPRCITRSSGCVNHLAIVETSVGIFYQSIRGIELLPRGFGEPQFVGVQVQDTLGATLVISAAVVSTGKDRTVRFCYGGANVLVWDMDTQAWSRDSYSLPISGVCDTDNGAVFATIDPDSRSNAVFLLEDDAVATDESTTNAIEISSTLTWARVRPFGVAGQGRFSAAIGLFDAETPGYRTGNATITLAVDDQSEPGFTFNMSTLSGASYRKVAPRIAEGSAGELTLVTDVAGWRFMGWTIEMDDLGGGRRMGEMEQG